MTRSEARNYPFDDVVATVKEIVDKGDFMIFQKFTCHNCGQRLTMSEPNRLYDEGTCDKCGTLTNIRETGCNYLLVTDTPMMRDVINKLNEEEKKT